jgi:YVTN family beta-propeller protein
MIFHSYEHMGFLPKCQNSSVQQPELSGLLHGILGWTIGYCAFPVSKSIKTALVSILIGVSLSNFTSASFSQESRTVGSLDAGGRIVIPTDQYIRAAGESVAFCGRPVDIALSPNGEWLYAKDDRGLVVVDAKSWRIWQELPFPHEKTGGSMHGLVVPKDGKVVYATSAQRTLYEARGLPDGKLKWNRSIILPPFDDKVDSHPTGIALTVDGSRAYVCISRNNTLGVVDLQKAKLIQEIPVGVAPYAVVLSRNEAFAYVSNWGGRRPHANERTSESSGTPVLVDERGIGSSGTVGRVDLRKGRMDAESAVGLHPSGLVLDQAKENLYVACANSDTICVIDCRTMQLRHTVLARPRSDLPFGSGTNAVALSKDGKTLYAANAGNNAVAVFSVAPDGAAPVLKGFIPTGWYPGSVLTDEHNLYIANVKGEGSRSKAPGEEGWQVSGYRGTLSKVAMPTAMELQEYTRQVHSDARLPQMLRAFERARRKVKPVPVPARAGSPSVFEHVVYVIKENRTYDQVFGDMKEGNGDANLCLYGWEVTPNHHELARQFVLLDNFYCNGVVSADGHSWSTEGYVTDHLEKSFGGFTRSYTWGDDPLTFSSSGFIWDHVLMHGLTFRNYGEMDYTKPVPEDTTFEEVFQDYRNGTGKVAFKHSVGIERLRHYTAPSYPGWNLKITDNQRIDQFLQEFRKQEQTGDWPNLVLVYLPQDHTSGTKPDFPTPRAHLADNDLALGRLVEAISNSRYWPKTCIFVVEDDPQDGFDHVDGHRSICLVVSPYTRRKKVISEFYNQTSVLHTMEQILGLPPMNQMDALAPIMTGCFVDTPDLAPYHTLPARVALNEVNKKVSLLQREDQWWATRSQQLDFGSADQADEDSLNRILWSAARGGQAPYPAHLAGSHGRGLAALKLRHAAR